MNISKISNTSFKGSIVVDGDIKIFQKGEKLETREQLAKSGKHLRNVFSGSYVKTANLDNIKASKASDGKTLQLHGLIEIDTDRIETITPHEIELRSSDNNTVGFIGYNYDNDKLRQLLAINAYHTAKNDNVTIGIDD